MDDRYLDAEKKFYNYRTSQVDGTNIFDVNKASNSWAQNFLDDPRYMLESENSKMSIVPMSPKEYWEICARDVFNKPVNVLMKQWRELDSKTLEHLTQVILKYNKRFPITYINYASYNHPTQEGLHRMIVAGDLFGWDTKFPVMVIEWADEEKAAQEKLNKRKHEVENRISRAIDNSLRYVYYNIEELKDQLYSDIEDQLKYDDEFENKSFKLDLVDSGDRDNPGLLAIVDDKYECFISYDDLNFKDKEDVELDDLDLDELTRWLDEDLQAKYALTTDFLQSNSLLEDLKLKFGDNYSKSADPLRVCQYIKSQRSECEILSLGIAPCRYVDYMYEPLSESRYAVIRYEDKLYDYTSDRYIDQGILPAKQQPRILTFDSQASKLLGITIYKDGNYIIAI